METEKPKRRRRTKAEMEKAGLKRPDKVSLAQKLKQAHKQTKRNLKDIARDLFHNELIVIAGLTASGLQIMYAFSYGGWSWVPAFFKAAFIEACVYSLNRAISWAGVVRLKGKYIVFMWAVLIAVMFISTRANLQYEYQQRLNAKNETICKYEPEECVVTSQNVNKYLDKTDIFDAWLRGGLIQLLILGMIGARWVLRTGAAGFEHDEMKRIFDSLRGAERRENEKKERARIEKSVGLSGAET